VQNHAPQTPAPRRSARIASAASGQSTIALPATLTAGSAGTDDSQVHDESAAQPLPSHRELLSRLSLDFTYNDLHASEDVVIAASECVYLADVLPYYRDIAARHAVANILVGIALGEEADEK